VTSLGHVPYAHVEARSHLGLDYLFLGPVSQLEPEFSIEVGFVGRTRVDDDPCEVAEFGQHRGDLLSGHSLAAAEAM
jgi:hypothetical protein